MLNRKSAFAEKTHKRAKKYDLDLEQTEHAVLE